MQTCVTTTLVKAAIGVIANAKKKPSFCRILHCFVFDTHAVILTCLSSLFFFLIMKDESQDFIKRQQLRELALLNSNNLREESPGPSGGGSVSPFNSSGKRPKTGC